MNREREKSIVDAHPEFFPDFRGDPARTCLAWGLAIGDGWANLFGDLCADIKAAGPGPDFAFTQVKEKFGGLRVYCRGATKPIMDLIDQAERDSYRTCESCGTKEGVTCEGKSWIQSLCHDCRGDL